MMFVYLTSINHQQLGRLLIKTCDSNTMWMDGRPRISADDKQLVNVAFAAAKLQITASQPLTAITAITRNQRIQGSKAPSFSIAS
jgi:hypothetical protein